MYFGGVIPYFCSETTFIHVLLYVITVPYTCVLIFIAKQAMPLHCIYLQPCFNLNNAVVDFA